ncbi:MAG: alpha/beta hydrolase [Flavobacteriaceae bacterium]|nr:alpha/beta hydrolase [Flavobacteriaceae bacterium]
MVFLKKNIKELFYDENNITEEELEQMWYLVDCNNGRSLVKFIYNYLKERNIAFTRWTTAFIETVVPIKVIWGIKNESEKDDYPESLIYKVEKKNVCWIEKSGHFPMLENPKEFVEAVFK